MDCNSEWLGLLFIDLQIFSSVILQLMRLQPNIFQQSLLFLINRENVSQELQLCRWPPRGAVGLCEFLSAAILQFLPCWAALSSLCDPVMKLELGEVFTRDDSLLFWNTSRSSMKVQPKDESKSVKCHKCLIWTSGFFLLQRSFMEDGKEPNTAETFMCLAEHEPQNHTDTEMKKSAFLVREQGNRVHSWSCWNTVYVTLN